MIAKLQSVEDVTVGRAEVVQASVLEQQSSQWTSRLSSVMETTKRDVEELV